MFAPKSDERGLDHGKLQFSSPASEAAPRFAALRCPADPRAIALLTVAATLIAIAVPLLNFMLLVAVGLDLTVEDFVRVRRRLDGSAGGAHRSARGAAGGGSGVDQDLCRGPGCDDGDAPARRMSDRRHLEYLQLSGQGIDGALGPLTALSCLGAAFTIPLITKGYELVLQQPLGFTAPIPLLIGQLFPILVVPVALGMWLRKRSPEIRERYGPALRRVAFIGTGFLLLTIIVDTSEAFTRGLSQTVPLASAFVLSSVALGWMTGLVVSSDARPVRDSRRVRLAQRDRRDDCRGHHSWDVSNLVPVAVTYSLVEVPLLLASVRGSSTVRVPLESKRYEGLGFMIPSLAMRVSSVVGLSPSRSAAPPAPRIRHPAISSTLRMCSLCTSSSRRLRSSTRVTGRAMVSTGPVARIIALSTRLRISRMLPGQL